MNDENNYFKKHQNQPMMVNIASLCREAGKRATLILNKEEYATQILHICANTTGRKFPKNKTVIFSNLAEEYPECVEIVLNGPAEDRGTWAILLIADVVEQWINETAPTLKKKTTKVKPKQRAIVKQSKKPKTHQPPQKKDDYHQLNDLMPVHNKNGKVVINARELHRYLEINEKFIDWIKRLINDYDFVENTEYVSFSEKSEKGGRPSIQYAITLDMGKEISMLQKTEKGKCARKYFIECENQINNPPLQDIPDDAASQLALAVIERDKKLAHKTKQLETTKQKLQFVQNKYDAREELTNNNGYYTVSDISGALTIKISGQIINKFLCDVKVQYIKNKSAWHNNGNVKTTQKEYRLYHKYKGENIGKLIERTAKDEKGDVLFSKFHLRWTLKGAEFILFLLKTKGHKYSYLPDDLSQLDLDL